MTKIGPISLKTLKKNLRNVFKDVIYDAFDL